MGHATGQAHHQIAGYGRALTKSRKFLNPKGLLTASQLPRQNPPIKSDCLDRALEVESSI
jgi:hypothetical protein